MVDIGSCRISTINITIVFLSPRLLPNVSFITNGRLLSQGDGLQVMLIQSRWNDQEAS